MSGLKEHQFNKFLAVVQCVSNSPSKIRGGKGALMLHDNAYCGVSYSSGASRHLPYLRGGVDNQHFIFIEFTLK
jgi:hypothetical protein